MTNSEKIIRGILTPSIPLRLLWRRFPIGSFPLRLKFEAVERPQYAFGIYHAAKLASRLGIPRISVIEFGVAGGKGLLAMERLAKEVSDHTNVDIDVYGFDTGKGLPKPTDYRDLPYMWHEGEYKMDYEKLSRELKNAKLIIGDVKETLPKFLDEHHPAPIGFISFDLDLYSSTKHAFQLLDIEEKYFLPRVLSYFDDILDGDAMELFNHSSGELLAIDEFNESHRTIKICPVSGLPAKTYVKSSWPNAIYAIHYFNHKDYNTTINAD